MPTAEKTRLICVTPMKNEAWILDRFLQCASVWADHIILADQRSEDESREIAARYPKVEVHDNPFEGFNEDARQRILRDAARRHPGPRLLIALDADEMLTANVLDSEEWKQAVDAPPGTVIQFDWVNVRPDFKTGWIPEGKRPFGFKDDDSDHTGDKMHGDRIPAKPDSPRITLKEVKVLHYQFTDQERVASKHRWYPAWERVNHPNKRPAAIFRQYHHMDAVPLEQEVQLDPKWFANYEAQGINMKSVNRRDSYWWDRDVLDMFAKYGVEYFRHTDLWENFDWNKLNQQIGNPAVKVVDPQSALDRRVLKWLHATQKHTNRLDVRLIQRALRFVGW